jgi:hypothetical protein
MRQLRFLPSTLCLLLVCASTAWAQEKPTIITFKRSRCRYRPRPRHVRVCHRPLRSHSG